MSTYEPRVEWAPGQPCPDKPIYEPRGGSVLRIAAKTGAVLEDRVAPGQAAVFNVVHDVVR